MERGIIIAFLQIKGGVGKSTLAENVAVSFANEGVRVKIIDCDLRQRTSSKWVARRSEYHPNLPKIYCSIQAEDLREAIVEDSKNYDTVIIDVQGRDSKSLRIALLTADIIYIPFSPSQNDIETIEELVDLLDETKMQNRERTTFYILNNCSVHYLDQAKEDACQFFIEHSAIITPSKVKISHKKIYITAASEGLGVIECNDVKAKDEILSLKEEIKQYV